MPIDGNQLGKLINTYCLNSDTLGCNGLTKPLKKNNLLIGVAVAAAHNKWQNNVSVSGVIVNGGVCAAQGALSQGIGIMAPGSVSTQLSGLVSALNGNMIPNEMSKYTKFTKDFMKAICNGFQDSWNQFLSLWALSNIQVSGGTCSCMNTPGGPVPGSYSGGKGQLTSLYDATQGVIPTAPSIGSKIKGYMSDDFFVKGKLTPGVKEHIAAISKALDETIVKWLKSTKLDNLSVSGGLTFPGAPIVGATGSGGQLI